MTTQKELKEYGQEHLLRFADELTPEELEQLQSELTEVDFELIDRLVSDDDEAVDWSRRAMKAEPPPAARLDGGSREFSREQALEAGEAALRAGKVGMILVAGGQGTRLGFDQPKGMFPIGPLSNRTLFQMHCDHLQAVCTRYQTHIPMYVMTSPQTDDPTREFFQQHDRCGLAEDQLRIFRQGTMPAVDDQQGKILLASKSSLALSPDGHGGLVSALDKNGCLEDAKRRGIEYFYYAQVDNPLAELCDPELIGYHILEQSQLTTQVVTKRFPEEKVGNVVSIDGKVQIIEYSDLPQEAAEQRTADGSFKLWAGNIAVHVFDLEFLESVINSAAGLPFHRAHKKVPYVDASGELVEPDQPNAIKFERFVFDLLPMAERAFVVEGDPAKVFAPVKNADGAEVDTPEHAKQAILALHRSWLEQAGATLADGVQVEIHPAWALDAEEVNEKLADEPMRFEADTLLR